jgi:hypothetical protein
MALRALQERPPYRRQSLRPIPPVPGALFVHAKDDNAKAFYEHFTFEVSPSDRTICCLS